MPVLPAAELIENLLPAYSPCSAFQQECRSAKWCPEKGFVPRGFLGAIGSIQDVRLVLLTAEPGDPLAAEIDIYTAPRLRELLIDLVGKGSYQLVINLDKVGFLDSTGLRCWSAA